MKPFFFLLILLSTMSAWSANEKSEQWQKTTLSDETIDHIQKAKYKYMQCITNEVQKKTYIKMDTRVATDAILQKCEKVLSGVRTVFNKENVPVKMTDGYLKKTRTHTARKVLQELMYADAVRKTGKSTPQ